MINTKDQEELLKLIADYLSRDVECYAIGGTAMIFYGYKNATKDIDLVFLNKDDCEEFIKAIEKLGYSKKSLKSVYNEKRIDFPSKPRIYSRGDERFDLFIRNVFGFEFKNQFKELIREKIGFISKKELIINILPIEFIILLKAITHRERDLEDVQEIADKEKNIDWDLIINEAIKQKENNPWMLIDLEKTMRELKKKMFIPSKYFEMIYKAEEKMKKWMVCSGV